VCKKFCVFGAALLRATVFIDFQAFWPTNKKVIENNNYRKKKPSY
jgi:hypothetical protein